ncbi:MAG: hypothetical protein A2087_11710 [Spirochaetes bacterium GWD1_61_31]|nr:MAG: hypothetical protein A2Y37_13930 [Spirochaetes bacterium GWB1_60_80]OHD31074.1 MAG: hypothetical protein A2004_07740 [Spirochaetes bacterium GWC1_61_12]OHD41628.1 MAG: hypothetical protein A2087_11710 [Spirochaetes bacterium GWD1_61_31]OHD45289.1 MAG: hypothetical protein A2Y35_02510 [Spirochaetes bacterium GWE1_60_18]OHD59595.1 MAG: hypothetical protein A2Y32_12755 [Spirochaetes bacterium GWF1_60_12]HAP43993.1 class I SAM-dependent methyltransferase [Spirochaetaceae bacterium]
MQDYGADFSVVYDKYWSGFSTNYAPLLRQFLEERLALPPGRPRRLVDLCCGNGRLTAHFAAAGWQVTGLDRSPAMLERAAANNLEAVKAGAVRLVEADAASFRLEGRSHAVVSTFDALNHLDSLDTLAACFGCVRASLVAGGIFIFDLNTRQSLHRWTDHSVQEEPDATIIRNGLFVPEIGKAWLEIKGFLRQADGSYRAFREMMFNTVFDLAAVRAALLAAGFGAVETFRGGAALEPTQDPEAERRVFFVATAP